MWRCNMVSCMNTIISPVTTSCMEKDVKYLTRKSICLVMLGRLT